MNLYGTPIERGTIVSVTAGGARVASTDRPGIVTMPLKPNFSKTMEVGWPVYFLEYEDGTGVVISHQNPEVTREVIRWGYITEKPTAFTPASHVHGNITNDGKIGSDANLPIFTGDNGTINVLSVQAAAALFGFCNPNLLINGDFQIWQGGTVCLPTSRTYGPDRWGMFDSPPTQIEQATITDAPSGMHSGYCMKVTTTGGTFNIVAQPIEMHSKLSGKTVTLSFWAKAPIGKKIRYYVGSVSTVQIYTGTGNWEHITFSATFAAGTATREKGVAFDARPEYGVFELYIAEVKLEFGSIATKFTPRTYAEELAMCQRYFLNVNPSNSASPFYGGTFAMGPDHLYLPIILPVTMRATPSLIRSGALVLRGSGYTEFPVNSIAANAMSGTAMKVYITSTGLTQGSYYTLEGVNANNISFDAEIY